MFYEDQVKESQPEKQATHTPGPWEACDGASITINEALNVTPNHVRRQFIHADGVRVTQFIADCNTALPESVANARLIAAAPELLEALKSMDCAVCDCSLGHPMRVIDRCSFCAKSRAAIAKAEGREGR